MNINTNSLVSLRGQSEFSRWRAWLMRMCCGHLKTMCRVILSPEFSEFQAEEMAFDEDVKSIAAAWITKHRAALRNWLNEKIKHPQIVMMHSALIKETGGLDGFVTRTCWTRRSTLHFRPWR